MVRLRTKQRKKMEDSGEAAVSHRVFRLSGESVTG
jgi:hypothetical protein